MKFVFDCSNVYIGDVSRMIIKHPYSHTCISLAADAKQFRVVFIRCGGSEKKYRKRPSDAYLFGTLCTTVFALVPWSERNRLFADAPSNVIPMTLTCRVKYCNNGYIN